MQIQVSVRYQIPSASRIAFNLSYTSLLVINSFSFCLFEKDIHFSVFERFFFLGIDIWAVFFPFSTLKLFLHCLLVCILSEKSSVILVFITLSVVWFFPSGCFQGFLLLEWESCSFWLSTSEANEKLSHIAAIKIRNSASYNQWRLRLNERCYYICNRGDKSESWG